MPVWVRERLWSCMQTEAQMTICGTLSIGVSGGVMGAKAAGLDGKGYNWIVFTCC